MGVRGRRLADRQRFEQQDHKADLTDVGLVVLLFEALPISEAAAAHSSDGGRTAPARVTSA